MTGVSCPTRRALLGGAVGLGLAATARAQDRRVEQWARPRLRFGAIGLDHGHIDGQCEALIRGGGAPGGRVLLVDGKGVRRIDAADTELP